MALGVKQLDRVLKQTTHLYNAQVRNVWGYTAIPLHSQGQLYRYLDQLVCSLLQQMVTLLLT